MLQILHGLDATARLDKKVKVTNPVTVIPSGACVKLDSNGEIVLTGSTAASEDFVLFALNSANVATEINSGFKSTSDITLAVPHPSMVFSTDQYKRASSVQTTVDIAANKTVATTNYKLYVRVDGGDVQSISFTQGAGRTPTQLVADLNHATTGIKKATSSVVSISAARYIKIESNSGGLIEIIPGVLDSYTLLGFTAGINAIGQMVCSELGLLDVAAGSDYVVCRSLGNIGGGLVMFAAIPNSAVA